MRLLFVAAAIFTFAMQIAAAEEISSVAQYEAAISSGKLVRMHPNLNMKFGRDVAGTLATFRLPDENDYSSVLIYGAGHMLIKKYEPDQAARYRVDAAFDINVGGAACIVFIESEGVGINGPGAASDSAGHRGLVFCPSGNGSRMNDALTARLAKQSGAHGIQSASQVRKILRDYIAH